MLCTTGGTSGSELGIFVLLQTGSRSRPDDLAGPIYLESNSTAAGHHNYNDQGTTTGHTGCG